ncbi:MAG: hypothetical protein CVU39_07550 [Chloroflexi bacterium HGW-Chloroflexi-10]|nr:MAG: hypothetical protein CVU39_07550 [Chloroflexi bacterium HGW-Chloroflexi-10]
MDNGLFLIVVIWLGVVSWFDIRRCEIPHSAWVILPLLSAMIYRATLGGWSLVVYAGVVALASERERLASWTRLPIHGWSFWIPPLVLVFTWATSSSVIGSIAILGFWIAWEVGAWGGADAVASICLVLLWPELHLIAALLGMHLVVALGSSLYTWIKERRFRLHSLPGLPILLASVLIYWIAPR